MNKLCHNLFRKRLKINFLIFSGQRLMALFLCALFIISILIPPIKVLAETIDLSSLKTPMALEPKAASFAPAADADPHKPVSKPAQGLPPADLRGPSPDGKSLRSFEPHELINKRTATASVRLNKDGSQTETHYLTPHYYKNGSQWAEIKTRLIEDKNAADGTNWLTRTWGTIESWFDGKPTTFKVEANDWQPRFAPSQDAVGMLRLQKDGQTVTIRPNNAASIKPIITTDSSGRQTVHYYSLWQGIDVQYEVHNAEVKEFVIIKDKEATTDYSFTINGASLEADTQNPGGFRLKGALEQAFAVAPINVILQNHGLINQTAVRQDFKDGKLVVHIDNNWLQALPSDSFPLAIDPSFFRSDFGTRAGGNYVSFKSDGYVCNSATCNLYAGSLLDTNSVWRWWRGAFYSPYDTFRDSSNVLLNANLHLTQRTNAGFWTGNYDGHWFDAWHATCLSFGCIGQHSAGPAWFGMVGDIDVTGIYQTGIQTGDFGRWIMVTGEEGAVNSFKNFDPDDSYIGFTYNVIPPAPSIAEPTADGQVYTDPQVSLRVNPISDPDGGDGNPTRYYFRVATGADGETGSVVNSGNVYSTQWTVPDGVLQDGVTYYFHAYSFDGINYSAPSPVRAFKIDLRRGKDKTQTFDTLGPVSVDLATGNVFTDSASHSSAALGGSLGIGLDYNSPVKSRPGLVGEYWNTSGYVTTIPSTPATLTRVDQNIDFNWDKGSPLEGTIADDYFATRWSGYFVAPVAGTYYLGGSNDDHMRVIINGQTVYDQGCYGSVCYNNPINLTAGQAVPIQVEFFEGTWTAYARLFVKGPVAEQVVPKDWLQTGVRPVQNQYGLIGRYFQDSGNHQFPSDSNQAFLTRTDSQLNFNWGTGAPVPGGYADFLARWTGYITAPSDGDYIFCTNSDDGSRIKINDTVVMDGWSGLGDRCASAVHFSQGETKPITVEFYDGGGTGSLMLYVKGAVAQQVVPSTWLSAEPSALPAGWAMSIDPDGNLGYDRIKVGQTSAILTDSSGDTHEYKWDITKNAYLPPVNEYGNLSRNLDGSFTLQDADGRTYVFDVDGKLKETTTPADDSKPAALRYEYEGTPARLKKIIDGVTAERSATVYYSGDSNCGTAPTSFDSAAPANMLCAVKTNDGRASYFYYKQGNLARIALPGGATTDYQYDNLGRIIAIRDEAASDAITAGTRADDNTALTQISYDALGRATSVTQPAATPGAQRMRHNIDYLPAGSGYSGASQQHIVGAPEPNGFSRRVEYDNTFRTTKETDKANLSTVTEWDPIKDLVLSATDALGLKTTTIYDDGDRPTHSYGPAPAAWFAADRTPLAANASQVPHSQTAYDEGLAGPGVAWYNVKGNSFFGTPKAHTTGLDPSQPTWLGYDFRSAAPPFTPDPSMDGYGFSATGKIRFPGSGTYLLQLWHDDGARVWIDDKLVIDDWNYRSEGIAQDSPFGTFIAEAGKSYRFRFDYLHTGTAGGLALWTSGPGIADTSGMGLGTIRPDFIFPDYGLVTTTKAYDAQIGDSETKTNYGPNPELGLAQSTTLDPSGLNLTSTATYEAPGSGFLRQTAKTLPGGTTTNYSYYSATDTRDNPCTTEVEAYHQAGMSKGKAEADPDGSGPLTSRTTETIYDEAGRAVASRYNSDAWTCTTYDARSRVVETKIPSLNGQPARTITNNWAVGGNPLVVSSADNQGTITTTTDLLGRTTSYTDTWGNTTTSSYDTLVNLEDCLLTD